MEYLTKPYEFGQRIYRILLANQESQTLLFDLAKAIATEVQAEVCLLVAQPPSAPSLTFGCWSAHPTLTLPSPESLQSRVSAWLIPSNEPQPVAIADLKAQPTSTTMSWLGDVLGVQSLLKISLPLPSEAVGLVIVGRKQPQPWSEVETALLRQIKETIALAIAYLHQHQQLETNRRYQRLRQRLSEVIRNTSNPSELPEVFQAALTETGQALQVERGLVLMLKYIEPPVSNCRSRQTPPQAKVEVSSTWTESNTDLEEHLSDTPFSLNECPCCLLAWQNSPRPLAVADLAQEASLSLAPNPHPFYPALLPALLLVPLLGTTNSNPESALVFGFLAFQHQHSRPWQREEIELVNWVSTQVSTAIRYTNALQRVQSLVEERTAQLQRSLDVQAKLHETTRQQVRQLRRLNQLKDEFLSTISHELNTPLATMTVALRMLKQTDLPPQRREKYLAILEQELQRESNLIDDLLRLQQLQSKSETVRPQRFNLKPLIDELAALFKQKWSDRGLNLIVEYDESEALGSFNSPFILHTDPDSLKRILLELLTNAGKYSDPNTTVRLSVMRRTELQQHLIVLSLTNIGPGISPDEQPHIFEHFRRGEGATQRAIPGTGVGLALVKCLVQQLNGKIEVASQYDAKASGETCFTLTLPQFWKDTS